MPKGDSDSAQKTKPPTRWRLLMARRDGDVPKSKDLTSAVVLAAWTVAGVAGAATFLRVWRSSAQVALAGIAHPTNEAMLQNLRDSMDLTASVVLVVLAPIALVGLAAQFAQVGAIFAPGQAALDLSRLNPAGWFQRLGKWEVAVELLKGIAKQAIVVVIAYNAVKSSLPLIMNLSSAGPASVLPVLGQIVERLFVTAAAIGMGLGLLDFLYQRFIYMKDMKMSVAEFQRDRKFIDGDPKLKARRRQLHREWANQSAAAATRGAAVVVVNPTHYAVALAYDPAQHAAPVVAAKGQDDVAADIRRAAELAEVPIIRSPALARELHERVDIDDTVPEDLFTVVAEVIVWGSRLRSDPAAVDSGR